MQQPLDSKNCKNFNSLTPSFVPRDLTEKITKCDDQYCAGGSFGDVYRCKYHNTDCGVMEVAVKTFRFEFTVTDKNGRGDRCTRMIRRELGIWRRLNHPNIVPFLGIASGFGRLGNTSLVSEWMSNGTLQNFLQKYSGQLTASHRLRLLLDAANGLEYLHSLSIVHGDLTPSNVLLDDDYTARLTDFGYASLVGEVSETQAYLQASTLRSGAVRWTAPECVLPHSEEEKFHCTIKSDIYSFGSVALQVLSGERPWSEISRDEAIIIQLFRGHRPRRPPSRPIEDQHWVFIEKCWSVVGERPSAEHLVSSIQHFLRVYPITQSFCDLLEVPHKPEKLHFESPNRRHDQLLDESTRFPPREVPYHPQLLILEESHSLSCQEMTITNTAGGDGDFVSSGPQLHIDPAVGRPKYISLMMGEGPTAPSNHVKTAGGSSKLRTEKVTIACNFCRSRKLKCDGRRPACGQCRKRSIPCYYMPQISKWHDSHRHKEDESESEGSVEERSVDEDDPSVSLKMPSQPLSRSSSNVEKLPVLDGLPLNSVPFPAGYKFGGKDAPTEGTSSSDRREKAKSRSFWNSGKPADRVPTFTSRAVFGVPLDKSLEVAEIARLPAVVFRCIQYLEAKKADQEEGIYRLSGRSAVIKGLKDRFNTEGDVDLLASDEYWDPHAISGLLKRFLRELPTSILTHELYMKFHSVIDFVEPQERIRELSYLIASLPIANYSLLRALTAHLILIVQNSSVNRMTMRNIGIVFSPTLGIPAGVFSLMLGEFNRVFNVDAVDEVTSEDEDGELSRRNSQQYSDTAADQLLGLTGSTLKNYLASPRLPADAVPFPASAIPSPLHIAKPS